MRFSLTIAIAALSALTVKAAPVVDPSDSPSCAATATITVTVAAGQPAVSDGGGAPDPSSIAAEATAAATTLAEQPPDPATGGTSSSGAGDVADPTSVSGSEVQPTGSAAGATDGKRYLAYYSIWAATGQPTEEQLAGVTHVVLAFMNNDAAGETTWATAAYTFSPETITALKANNRKVMMAVGGWNNDYFFRPRTSTNAGRKQLATDIKTFIDNQGLDGVDIDWEYPVDNGQGYKLPPSDPKYRGRNDADTEYLTSFLSTLRQTLGSDKLISIAVPAREVDMIAYEKKDVVKSIDASVDWWNVMSYDFLNRRDKITTHQGGGDVIANNLAMYGDKFGIDKTRLNMGFPMYAKWFNMTQPCDKPGGIGCTMDVYEDENGGDLGNSGAALFNQALNTGPEAVNYATSFKNLNQDDHSDTTALASSYFDKDTKQFWTWTSPDDIYKSCQKYKAEVGGMFVWSLNQDTQGAGGGTHLQKLAECMQGQ